MMELLRTTRLAWRLWLPATLVPAAVVQAQEIEEILSYDVLVDVRPGGELVVNETITVRALGEEIRRGIYRDFPTSFPRSSGLGRIEAPFEVLGVRRNGRDEPYAVLSIGVAVGRGGLRIRAGHPDVFLEPGIHEYVFEYRTDRWVRFGGGEDRLYWNVTGNGWDFPIRSASARIRIQELGVEPLMEAWAGPEGSTEGSAAASWDALGREASFLTTRALGPREGLTVRLTFPSGHLTPPSEAQQAEWFALDWGGYRDAGYIVLLVIALYLLMWRRVGMDPAPGPTVLRDQPPAGFSPAALAYLEERGYEVNQLAAALVSMATKGAVRIERRGRSWKLHKENEDADLSADERRVFRELLGPSSSVDLEQSQHARLRAAIKGLKQTLSRQLEREYFVNNRRWFLAGLAVSLAGLAALTWRWRFGVEPAAWFLGLWLTGWTAGVATMIARIFHMARLGKSQPLAWGGAVLLGLFALPFIGAEVVVAGMLTRLVPTHLVVAVLLVGATNVLFYHLLERPTLRGRGVLNELDGFRAYLASTDRGGVADAGERFQSYLPHAIALRLEERWADGFGAALVPTGPGAERAAPVPWYDDGTTDTGRFDASSFASSLGPSLASTLSAASSPPSSGGGGSGGGSSGGGGGGGGGGGW